jgi:hypothetical protein
MALYIDAAGNLHYDKAVQFSLTCPHCLVLAHLTPLSVPQFAPLMALKPTHVGIVYSCDACHAPVFLKYAVKMYATSRIELSAEYTELERAPEPFQYTHLPEEPEQLFREALTCFNAGAYNAFGSMCRRVAQAIYADLGDNGKLRLFDQLNDIREMAELDAPTFNALRKVLFSSDAEPRPNIPLLDDFQAGILLEVMKDLLYQAYVRRGQLQQAMMVRRHALEDTQSKITPITKRSS